MTREQASEVESWRSSPLSSKTCWTIYIGQLSLAIFAAQLVSKGPVAATVLLAIVAGIIALAITGVAGIAWTDPAVQAVRAFKGATAAAGEGAAVAVAVSTPSSGPAQGGQS